MEIRTISKLCCCFANATPSPCDDDGLSLQARQLLVCHFTEQGHGDNVQSDTMMVEMCSTNQYETKYDVAATEKWVEFCVEILLCT